MKLYAETVLYGLQFASAFILAGPVLIRAERQRTLSRNPEWVFSNSDFLQKNRTVSLAPLKAGGILLFVFLAVAASLSSTGVLFAVHGPLFLLVIMGLILYYNKAEKRLRTQIPKDARQRAPLVPRSLFRFLTTWSVIPLIPLIFMAFSINGYGLYEGSIASGRVLGNIALLGIFIGAVLFGCYNAVNRQPYRTGNETDELARKFELRMILASAYFLCIVALYHAVGSVGPDSMLPQPPTVMHALFEESRFSWEYFFHDFHYRIVDYCATVFLIMLSGWISVSQFYKRVLSVDFRNSPSALDV